MRRLRFTIPPEQGGRPLRDYLRRELGLSARALSQLKHTENGIALNGAPCRVDAVLSPGDELTLCLPEEPCAYPAVPGELRILWETEDFLAVDKPWGMPVYPTPGHDRDSLLNVAAGYFARSGQAIRFRPLYRLDKDTSGILILAKHRVAAAARVDKRYFAVCEGVLSGAGTIELPIGLAPGSKIKRAAGAGEPAVTHWRVCASREGHTLLALRLETGRTHQIRVHFSHLGHPLAGDDLYGGSRASCARQALHCGWARVRLPALETDQTLLSPFPQDLRAAFPWLPEPETLLKEEYTCQPV